MSDDRLPLWFDVGVIALKRAHESAWSNGIDEATQQRLVGLQQWEETPSADWKGTKEQWNIKQVGNVVGRCRDEIDQGSLAWKHFGEIARWYDKLSDPELTASPFSPSEQLLTGTIYDLYRKHHMGGFQSADLSTYDHADEAFNVVAGAIRVLRFLATNMPDMNSDPASAANNVGRLNDLIQTKSTAGESELRDAHNQLNLYIDDLVSQLDTTARELSQSGIPDDITINGFKHHLSSVKRFVSAAMESNLGSCTDLERLFLSTIAHMSKPQNQGGSAGPSSQSTVP